MARTKIRISKKFLATLPQEVADYVKDWHDKGYVKSVTMSYELAPYTLYNGEGYRFFVYNAGNTMQLETVSSNTLGASNLNHDITGSTMIPANTIVVQVSYYCGYMMHIYKIGYPEIAD